MTYGHFKSVLKIAINEHQNERLLKCTYIHKEAL